MIILGIDPGLSGGLAFLEQTREQKPFCLGAFDVPAAGDGAKRRVDVREVLRLIQAHKPDHAFIERAQAMPILREKGNGGAQGASSAFIYGRATGALEAAVLGSLVTLTVVEPTAWKRTAGLLKCQKENSRLRALQLFPGVPYFNQKQDHNRAEAALIAWHGLRVMDYI
jgi:crossover junction endodeoxyribonuclease RuvC